MKIDPDLVIEAEKKLLSALMIKGGEAVPLAAANLRGYVHKGLSKV